MSRPRKTIKVSEIIQKCNKALASDHPFYTQEVKGGICNIAEQVLFSTDSYGGFRYLPSANVQNGGKPDVSVEFENNRQYIVKGA